MTIEFKTIISVLPIKCNHPASIYYHIEFLTWPNGTPLMLFQPLCNHAGAFIDIAAAHCQHQIAFTDI